LRRGYLVTITVHMTQPWIINSLHKRDKLLRLLNINIYAAQLNRGGLRQRLRGLWGPVARRACNLSSIRGWRAPTAFRCSKMTLSSAPSLHWL
jgi:hypothetical protein